MQKDNISERTPPPVTRSLFVFALPVVFLSLFAALALPKGFALAVIGDTLQVTLIAATALLALRNFLRGQTNARIFWFLTFCGAAIWTASNLIWAFYELWLKQPVPDSPIVDILLFLKIVPLTTAFAAAPHRQRSSPFRAFGLLDVSVLMIYTLYLYAFGVFSYRLLPGAVDTYNFRFNVADAVGNQIFMLGAAMALLTAQGSWKILFRIYFLAAACYGFSSDVNNVAIDLGRYYTGSLYDIPLIAALAGLVCVTLQGRKLAAAEPAHTGEAEPEALPTRATFISSHLAMLVMLSTPVIGIWLLSGATTGPLLRFRLIITLLTMLLLTLLLAIKEDLLAAGLITSLSRLSETYSSIERYKSELTQSEKLASLGKLVAEVANQIKQSMTAILDVSNRLVHRLDKESRVQNMAGKIGQYAQRTDALVDNMLHFAQETPTRLSPLDVKPLIQSALQLSRIGKSPNVSVLFTQEGESPRVRGDSSQLLHVFLELISNAADALHEVNGGMLEIKSFRVNSYLVLEFLDSGPGLKEPARVFEPFYTTKIVGKGTGLGLSTCYGILQQHQGEITCGNRPDGGARFTVRLPLAPQEVAEVNSTPGVLVEGAS
jgi:signal transduction histidine kinase